MSTFQAEPVGTYISKWGEGPIWHGNALLYVDIEAHKVIRFNPDTGVEEVWDVGERVGTVVPRDQGGFVYAGDNGLFFLDDSTGNTTPITDPEPDISTNRFNDGKCDPAGRFWAGTMDMNSPRQNVAALYCLEKDLKLSKKFDKVACSNGIVWTKDNKTMYYIDTPRKNVLAFDYDLVSGEISNERVAFETKDMSGNPDGMTIDAEDNLWIAFCHGGVVRCINPKTGDILSEVNVPARETTACAFGGPDFKYLYITTGLPGKDVEPLAGRVFVARPGVAGCKATAFAG